METLDNQVFNTGENTLPEVNTEIEGMHPWMRLTSILQIVTLGISLISNFALAAMVPFGAAGKIIGAVIGAVIQIFPLIYLLQSSAAFKDYLATGNRQSLLWGLTKQKAYWRYMGILAIIALAIFLLILIIMLAVGGSILNRF